VTGSWITWVQWFFLVYFIGINAVYSLLTLLSFIALKRYLGNHSGAGSQRLFAGLEPPVSILVPAYNEEATIAASVNSLLQLNYAEFEVIVVNDGSQDKTLEALQRDFRLVPFPEAYWQRLPVQKVLQIYRSTAHHNLRVIDKVNGGKADALNAAINASRYPLVCGVDADSVLERNSLQRVVRPFLEDPLTIATGGTVRVANGCSVQGGFLTNVGLPRNLLALFQIVEYLRAFLFGRLGWSVLNAMLIISGAFGVFRKENVINVGGYRTDTLGEDMELIVRLHRVNRLAGTPYRITFVPDPVCWTEAPETLGGLKNQRVRWQRGLAESLSMNTSLLLHPRGGTAGWIAFPFMALFEWLGPVIEVAGYVLITAGFFFGMVSLDAFCAFMLIAIGFGIMLSVSALLLEELSFHVYNRPRELAVLLVVSVLENFGYRQLNSVWRLWGLIQWSSGARSKWGNMTRSAKWHSPYQRERRK
jgi:cellulose synthase/poly-beta-1,6-N-acetylglucosamine synthase-like glycosyltransferase